MLATVMKPSKTSSLDWPVFLLSENVNIWLSHYFSQVSWEIESRAQACVIIKKKKNGFSFMAVPRFV